MLKRMLLSVTFVAALGAAGFGLADTAEARHKCHRGGFYGGYVPHTRVVHYHAAPYFHPAFYAPDPYYYAPGSLHYYRHGRRSSFGFSIGF